MAPEMRRALDERRGLIEARADALLDQALNDREGWVAALGTPPRDERTTMNWRRLARTVAAYRDRYGITAPTPLGAPAERAAQMTDASRARAALDRATALSPNHGPRPEPTHRPSRARSSLGL